ncbi:EF-hand domain-containing protein [Thalassoglobus polymorphus]|uniref:EF hand n=1 Tax=Thalassoglobus polymorphus TaxID=2527994 RepID=A0A517QRZ5_9PLAN|nr:EF-hand domain-containing protein [Thalassoglobus polymorphus]QDT34395.1 EF hand [Thalassoglobus polymorphus]
MKKVLFTMCLALGVAVTALSANAEEKPKKGKKPDLEAIFKKLDKDKSGDLTLEEFKGKRDEEKAKKAFARLDKDKNEKVTLKEFKERGQRKPKPKTDS